MSNSLDPDQGLCSLGSDLDPNCLQRLSADKWFRSISGPMLCQFWSGSQLFAKVISRQIVLIYIRTNALPVLIWIQTVCKGYPQTNGFDPHQDTCSVGSDLDPNCSQWLSADNKVVTKTISWVKYANALFIWINAPSSVIASPISKWCKYIYIFKASL